MVDYVLHLHQRLFSFLLFSLLQALKIPVTVSDNVKEALQTATDNIEIVFVCDPFEGEDFELLRKEEQRIIGPPIVHACAQQEQPLPYNSRPLYCSVMTNHIICFTGFRKKEELGRLCNLVHHMGGSIRREFSGRVTQLVANSIHGQKYRVSVWYTDTWDRGFRQKGVHAPHTTFERIQDKWTYIVMS